MAINWITEADWIRTTTSCGAVELPFFRGALTPKVALFEKPHIERDEDPFISRVSCWYFEANGANHSLQLWREAGSLLKAFQFGLTTAVTNWHDWTFIRLSIEDLLGFGEAEVHYCLSRSEWGNQYSLLHLFPVEARGLVVYEHGQRESVIGLGRYLRSQVGQKGLAVADREF